MARTSTRPRRGSQHHLTPSFGLFRPSYQIVRKHIWIFGPLYIVPFIFAFHSWLWTPTGVNAANHPMWHRWIDIGPGWSASPIPIFTSYAFIGFALIWFVFVIAAGTIVQIMTQEAQLEGSEGKEVITFNNLWRTVKETGWRMLGLYIVVGLYILVGLILLIVPGLIMIRRYFLAPYVMLDKRPKTISEAMEISANLSKPNSGSIWGIIGVMFLLGLISIVPIIGWLASFVLGMFYSVAPALRYQELKNLS